MLHQLEKPKITEKQKKCLKNNKQERYNRNHLQNLHGDYTQCWKYKRKSQEHDCDMKYAIIISPIESYHRSMIEQPLIKLLSEL